MNRYIIKSKQPNCKTCNRPLKEWIAFQEEGTHEHTECAAKRIANELGQIFKRNLLEHLENE